MKAARRLAVALVTLALTLVMLTGVARAGSSYTYCRMAETIGAAPCCNHVVSTEERPAIDDPDMDCCERHVVPQLPSADTAADRWAPPLAESLPAKSWSGDATLPPIAIDARLPAVVARAGPTRPRYASDVRPILMVFLR